MISKPYSRQQLPQLSAEQLAAVDCFELHRPGFGSLMWPGLTDLRKLRDQLDTIVRFEKQEVKVYPMGVEKPPKGEGLNKRCVYTMEEVWPKDRRTEYILTDARSVQAFKAQLQRKADRLGARMLSYNHERGLWRIEVSHF